MDALKNNKVLTLLILGLALVAALVLFSMFNQLGQEEVEEEVIEPQAAPAPAPAPEAAPLENPVKVEHNWNSPVVMLNQEQTESFLAGLKPAQNGHPANSDGSPYREASLEESINTPLVPESLE